MTRQESYFEDFQVGDCFSSPRLEVTREMIIDFARAYDPQPFHLSDEGAEGSLFKTLAASGWHTAAMSMRLLVESECNIAGGLIGQSIEELKWLYPVRPGDQLRNEMEVIETLDPKPNSRAAKLRFHVDVLNQDGVVVQYWKGTISVPKRPR